MSESTTAYPDVPDAAGVPPVLREPGAFATEDASSAPLMTSDADGLDNYQSQAVWGIFDDNGQPVIVADSVFAVDFRKEYRISDYPIEQGAFGSYNKVELPFDGKVSFTVGGSDSDRSGFLASVAAAVSTLDLYSLITPEMTYSSASVVHYDYRRTAQNGATLLTVEMWVEEVRVTGTSEFKNTAKPSGADPAPGGTVTPTNSPGPAPTPTADSPHDTPTPAVIST